MFTYTTEKASYIADNQNIERSLIHAICGSGDTKPTGWAEGSDCIEINKSTGATKIYFYDATGEAWVEAK